MRALAMTALAIQLLSFTGCKEPEKSPGLPLTTYEPTTFNATWARDGNVNDTYTTQHQAMMPKRGFIDPGSLRELQRMFGDSSFKIVYNPDGTVQSIESSHHGQGAEVVGAAAQTAATAAAIGL
ncbi:MAG: hypothetical protein HUU20_08315 [Pirellulales bacterium]|nr:hypothetical protein [Pirellulales bacterium]